MAKPVYIPFLEIKDHFGEVSRAPFLEDISGERLWRQSGAAPGVRSGIVRMALSKEIQFIEDPLQGQLPFQPRFLHHDYQIAFNDAGIGAWEQIPTEAEYDARDTAKAFYIKRRDDLFAKGEFSDADQDLLSDPDSDVALRIAALEGSKLNKSQQEQLAAALAYIPQFSAGGNGYLKEAYNLFDIGLTKRGIIWNFSVPNIPKTLISTFTLKQEQWQCFRIFRSAPQDNQARDEWELLIGNGNTQYALVFKKEEGIEFRHYRNMKPRARFLLEEQLNAVLDTGRITLSDIVQLNLWKTDIEKIQQRSKASGKKKPTGADSAAIRVLQAKIEALQKSKSGLTDAARAQKERLEKKLYYDVVQVSLQEDVRSLYNTMFDLTWSFHRKGYIGIRISQSEPVYIEIKGITKTLNYGTMLPKGCRIMIRSAGGKFFLAHGNPDFTEKAALYGQPFSLPYELGEIEARDGREFVKDIGLELDAVGIGDELAAPGDNLAKLPGCRVAVSVERVQRLMEINIPEMPLVGAIISQPAMYRVCLDSWSEPDPKTRRCEFSPEVYRGSIFIPGATGVLPEALVWSSRAQKCRLTDVLVQDDEERASIHEVYFDDDKKRPVNLPLNMEGRACDLGVTNSQTGEKIYLQQNGVVKLPGAGDIARLITTEGENKALTIERRMSSGFKLDVHGVATLLNRPVRYPLIGNNRPPAEYCRDMILAHGLPEWFVRHLPLGDVEGLERLPKASAGKPADIKPAVGASLINFLRGDVVTKHCLGWRFVPHPTLGCILEHDEDREAPELAFSSRLPYDNPLAILSELHWRANTAEYASEILVMGAYDPGRGERFSSYSRRYEASRARQSTYFTGTDFTYIAPADESLKSQTKCDLFARSIENKKGLPPIEADVTVWWRPELKTGLVPTFDGVRFVIKNIARSSLKIGLKQHCTLTLRLADPISFALSGGA